MRNEFDENAGLKEGRRVNPERYKLPPQTYMSLGDVLLVMGALVGALTLMANAEKVTEGLWQLWNACMAAIGQTPS